MLDYFILLTYSITQSRTKLNIISIVVKTGGNGLEIISHSWFFFVFFSSVVCFGLKKGPFFRYCQFLIPYLTSPLFCYCCRKKEYNWRVGPSRRESKRETQVFIFRCCKYNWRWGFDCARRAFGVNVFNLTLLRIEQSELYLYPESYGRFKCFTFFY